MKIFAIPHITPDTDEIAYHAIADSSLTPWRKPLFLPDFDTRFTISVNPYIVISRLGKSIPQRFASRYYTEGGIAIMVRAADLYQRLSANGLPTSRAVSFDTSILVSPHFPQDSITALWHDGIAVTTDDTTPVLVSCTDLQLQADRAIHLLSQATTLKTGDVIVFDIPDNGITITEGMRITISSPGNNADIHTFNIK